MRNKKIFIASLSSPLPGGKGFQFTAADQLSFLFTKSGIGNIINPHHKNRLLSLVNTLFFLLGNISGIDAAILPLYGTPNSIKWYKALEKILLWKGKKIFCVVHGGTIPDQLESNPEIFAGCFKNAYRVIVPSAYLQEALGKKNIAAEVIENSILLSAYPFTNKEKLRPHILWMRSFHEVYNPLMAVKAAALLANTYPDFKMVMAGRDSGLFDETEKLVHALGLQEKIMFPGHVDLPEKIKLSEEYDIYINTNIVDNAPVSVIEFMALVLPVVAADAGGLRYIITDKMNGLLCQNNDEKNLADKIKLLLNNPALAASVRSNARVYAEVYDEKKVIEKWKKVLQC